MDISALVWAVVDILVAGFIIYIVWLVLQRITSIDPLFKQIAMALVSLTAILVLASILIPLFGGLLGHGGGPALGYHARC
jgi:hypothetical protein